jgi:hypothetical protein
VSVSKNEDIKRDNGIGAGAGAGTGAATGAGAW